MVCSIVIQNYIPLRQGCIILLQCCAMLLQCCIIRLQDRIILLQGCIMMLQGFCCFLVNVLTISLVFIVLMFYRGPPQRPVQTYIYIYVYGSVSLIGVPTWTLHTPLQFEGLPTLKPRAGSGGRQAGLGGRWAGLGDRRDWPER